jgi:hypothetical protein
MIPLKWGTSISHNALPAIIAAPNRAKCMHALYLLNDVATDEQKEILGSKDYSENEAKAAAANASHLCMNRLWELECELEGKDPYAGAQSKAQPTAIGIGSRYQKYLAEMKRREIERKKAARRIMDDG